MLLDCTHAQSIATPLILVFSFSVFLHTSMFTKDVTTD